MRLLSKVAIAAGTLALLTACDTSPRPVAEAPLGLEGRYAVQQRSDAAQRYLDMRRAQVQARLILREINALRAANGLPALRADSTMSRVATAHSRDMANKNYFSHASPDGRRGDARLRAAGVTFTYWGENIGYQTGGSNHASRQLESWKNSPGHRANMLNANFKRIGIGAVRRASDDTWYYTTVFAD